jgi:uncharacterized protein YaaQ
MKLVIAIVHSKDADACTNSLTVAGHVCTRVTSYGGFLDKDNATLLIGVDDPHVAPVIEILRSKAKRRNEIVETATPVPAPVGVMIPPPLEVEVGGATVFVVDVAHFEKL